MVSMQVIQCYTIEVHINTEKKMIFNFTNTDSGPLLHIIDVGPEEGEF